MEDIDLIGCSYNELLCLTTRLEDTVRADAMEISSEKCKVLVNCANQNTPINITMNGQNLVEVDSFKYIGSSLSKHGISTKETKIRIRVAIVASISYVVMSTLNIVWKSRYISFQTEIKRYRALVIVITPTKRFRRLLRTKIQIWETPHGFPCYKARTLVGNGETTKALTQHNTISKHHFKNHPARHAGGQDKSGPLEMKAKDEMAPTTGD